MKFTLLIHVSCYNVALIHNTEIVTRKVSRKILNGKIYKIYHVSNVQTKQYTLEYIKFDSRVRNTTKITTIWMNEINEAVREGAGVSKREKESEPMWVVADVERTT